MAKYSRRDIIVTSLSSGFAVATWPVAASAFITSDEGLVVGEVQIPVEGGVMPAYRAVPARARKPPVMLVVQEIFGVHEHIKDVCRRFAKLGFMAVAPDLYARQGNVSAMKDVAAILSKVVARVPDKQVLADLDATASWAASTGPKAYRGNLDKLAVTGFCWGGRIAWLYAAHNPLLKAAVAFYGRLSGERSPMNPRQPLDVAGQLAAPVLGLYGGSDTGIPATDVVDMQAALKRAATPAAKATVIRVYPTAGHGFFADYRSSYRREDASEAWNETKTWLTRRGLIN